MKLECDSQVSDAISHLFSGLERRVSNNEGCLEQKWVSNAWSQTKGFLSHTVSRTALLNAFHFLFKSLLFLRFSDVVFLIILNLDIFYIEMSSISSLSY